MKVRLAKLPTVLAAAAAMLVLRAAPALACSVCYGDPDSPEVKAMQAGILVLLGCIGTVLTGFAGLFLYWFSRSRRLMTAERGAAH